MVEDIVVSSASYLLELSSDILLAIEIIDDLKHLLTTRYLLIFSDVRCYDGPVFD